MNQSITRHVGERVTFAQLFEKHPTVEIPIIQRDYAQGRLTQSESEVRTEFLKAIHAALLKQEGDPSLPLDLDFVYGSVESTARAAFCPLDGQQRLTTLFLLHWYLAWKDSRLKDFSALVSDEGRSRLCYLVRPSSRYFLDALVRWTPDDVFPAATASLAAVIADQPWFFLSWKRDPTVQSVLIVIDAIHERFAGSEGLYSRLMLTTKPFVTFQLLDLESFGLSDDLYIKMNARGKALTSFETFKARFEQLIGAQWPNERRTLHGKSTSLKEYVSYRIDSAWADVLWSYRDSETNLFDGRFMNLIRSLAVVTRNPDQAGVDQVIERLRQTWTTVSFVTYQESNCLDWSLVDTLVAVLDSWSGEKTGIRKQLPDAVFYDEGQAVRRALGMDAFGATYTDQVRFSAYCAYIRKHGSNPAQKPFAEWMRVVSNLAINTSYDGVDDFKRSIRSLNDLLNDADGILAALAGTDMKIRGFNEQQVREERLKAQLILRAGGWKKAILKAEQHGYFSGQIEFLLKFSGVLDAWLSKEACGWSEEENSTFLKSFEDYFERASAVFGNQGLKEFENYRWERALLAVGDYLLDRGGRNRAFLVNPDREPSWKRLLRGGTAEVEKRRSHLKGLLDRIDLGIGIKQSLDKVIAGATGLEEWRRVIVENPAILDYCRNQQVRWISPTQVYLLTKTQMNGEHAELFTYHLYSGRLSAKVRKGELPQVTALRYQSVKTDSEEPAIVLEARSGQCRLALRTTNVGNSFLLEITSSDGKWPVKLKAQLMEELDFKCNERQEIYRSVPRQSFITVIDAVHSAFAPQN